MPPRKVDERKTRKALRKLRRAVDAAAQGKKGSGDGEGGEDGDAPDTALSAWEKEFTESVEKRLETFGSAFTDPSKGALDEPLSARQAQKLAEIGRKARGKGKGLKRTGPIKAKGAPKRRNPRDRHIEDELGDDESGPDEPASNEDGAPPAPKRRPAPPRSHASPRSRSSPKTRPNLRMIKGGKGEDSDT